MSPFLYAIIIFFSTQIIFAFGESETDIDFLLYKGNQYFKLLEHEKAISLYDQILDKEPNNIEALYNIGNIYSILEKNDQAISFFEKALNIDPKNQYVQIALHNSVVKIASYKSGYLDGVMEIMVHNSEGNLIAFQRTKNILVLEHEITKNIIEKWPVSTFVTKNDQNFEIHQHKFVETMNRDTIIGFHQIPYSDIADFPISSTWYYQVPIEKGDVVTYAYSFLIPVR